MVNAAEEIFQIDINDLTDTLIESTIDNYFDSAMCTAIWTKSERRIPEDRLVDRFQNLCK